MLPTGLKCDCVVCRCEGLTCQGLVITSKRTGQVKVALVLNDGDSVSIGNSNLTRVTVYNTTRDEYRLSYPYDEDDIIEVLEAGVLLV